MGRIGPPQQRFEVLPIPGWDVEDLVRERQVDAPIALVGGDLADDALLTAEPDDD